MKLTKVQRDELAAIAEGRSTSNGRGSRIETRRILNSRALIRLGDNSRWEITDDGRFVLNGRR